MAALAAAAVELFLAFCSGFFTLSVVSASISIAKCVASAVLDIWGKKKKSYIDLRISCPTPYLKCTGSHKFV